MLETNSYGVWTRPRKRIGYVQVEHPQFKIYKINHDCSIKPNANQVGWNLCIPTVGNRGFIDVHAKGVALSIDGHFYAGKSFEQNVPAYGALDIKFVGMLDEAWSDFYVTRLF